MLRATMRITFNDKREPMKIDYLKEYPEYVRQTAEMVYQTFVVDTKSTKTFEDVVQFFTQQEVGELPITLIAYKQEKVCGTVSIFKNDLSIRPQYSPWLASLVVLQEERKQGIAKELIMKVTEIVAQLGFDELYLRTETASD